ncbi:MAG: flagellar export protein FliJ [Chitinispirillaceae bacterium]|nr:flagellar export protein FliJ [Chitinispirillaceae bacterium]
MKRFFFRLDTLLDLRKQLEERIKLRLAEKNRNIIEKNRELAGLHEQLKALQTSEKVRRGGDASVLLLRYGVAYRHKLKADILRVGRRIDDLRADAAKIRQELLGATKARRALEIVRDRQVAAWKKTHRREEQQFIDDIAGQKYIASR